MNDKANNQQLQQIHKLMIAANLVPRKADIVEGFSNGRETSSKGLTYLEADQLLSWLRNEAAAEDKSNKMRRKIISIFHRMQWQLEDGKADMKRIDEWCINKSYLNKPLMGYTYKELIKLVNQVSGFYSHFTKQVV